MKKFYSRSLVAVLSAFAALPAAADTVVNDDGLLFAINGNQAVFTGISGDVLDTVNDLVIPDRVPLNGKYYNVTGVAAHSCDNNPYITSLTLGENVRNIGAAAFQNCTNLTSVTLNEGLETIGENGFYKAPASNLALPATITAIGDLAFYGGSYKSVELPAALSDLGAGAFAANRSIAEFKIAEGNKHYVVTDGVLFNADKTILMAYPIGKIATSYDVPSTVKIIAPYSIRNASFLNKVTFNEGLDSIGNSAFVQGRLTEVALPSTLRAIGIQAFAAMPTISSFTVAEGNKYFKTVDGHLLTADGKCLLYGAASVADVVVPEGVEEVAGYSFYTFTGVKSLKLASTTKTVGPLAFYSNSSMSTVDFGTSLDSIGEGAFRRCQSIPAVELPATVRSIGNTAFAESNGIKEVKLNEGLESIGNQAFTRCNGIKYVSVPSTIKTMGYGVFVYCNLLEEVELAEGLTLLGDGAFQECLQLKKINFPSSLRTIGDFTFTSAAFTEINLNEGLERIGSAAFEFCKFTSLKIPDTVTEIAQFSFSWNSALESVTCGRSLDEIGNYAFSGATELKEITFTSHLRTLGDGALASCSKLPTVTLPSTVEYIGKDCFAEDVALKDINVKAVNPPTVGGPLYSGIYSGYREATLFVPQESVSAYERDDEWGKFLYIEGIYEGVESPEAANVSIEAVYDLNGVRLDAPARGVCLVRMSDGTVRKVIMK